MYWKKKIEAKASFLFMKHATAVFGGGQYEALIAQDTPCLKLPNFELIN